MKKLVAMLLCCGLMVSMLGACGGTKNTASSTGASEEKALDFPKYAITIQTSKSGSVVDYMARAFAKAANNYVSQNVIVNSAAGQLDALREVLNSAPDGYTLAITNNTPIINDAVGQTDFDVVEDLRYVAKIIDNKSSWLCIRSDFAKENGIGTFEDLKAYTQAHPGELIISDRIASVTNTAVNQLIANGFDVTPADCGDSSTRVTSFLGGQCDIFIGSYGLVEQYIELGDVICLALLNPERSAFSPDVPSTGELGYPDIVAAATYYLYAHKDTPEEIIDFLEEIAQQIVGDEGFITDVNANTAEPSFLGSEDAYAEAATFKKTMQEFNVAS